MAKRWVPGGTSFACAAWLTAAAGVWIVLGTGCGGDYSEKVENWTRNAGGGAAAAATPDLCAPKALEGTALQFSGPAIFSVGATYNSQGPDRRAKPPMMDVFPGLKETWEAFKELPDKPGTQAAFYFYIGATTAAAGAKQSVLDTFKTKLASQGQKIEDWVDFPVEPRTWRKLRCTGTQDFCVKDKDGKETFSSLPGVFEVYVLEESGSVVILAFRAPLSLEPEIGLEGMARAVANSVGKK